MKLVGNGAHRENKSSRNGGGVVFKEKRTKRRGVRTLVIILSSVLLLIAVAAAAYFIWERPPEHFGEGLAIPTPNTTAPGSVKEDDPSPSPTPLNEHDDDVYTFVVAGKDYVGANTDTIMVGAMNVREHTLDVVSIPRDTLVNTPYNVKKVNSLYAYSLTRGEDGITGLKDGVRDLLGFDVDFYALVYMEAFEKLVDAIGGVYYDVPFDMYYDDPDQGLHIAIPKGYQKLDGEDAMHVVRFRMGNNGTGYVNGDIGRIATQQDFLKSVALQFIKAGSISNLSTAADIFAQNVKTDLTAANVSYFARQFLLCSGENVRFHTLPGNYEDSIGGFSYVSLYLDEWLAMVNDFLSPWSTEITSSNVDILTHQNGKFSSTTGVVEGGENSFLTVDQYRAALNAEREAASAEPGADAGETE